MKYGMNLLLWTGELNDGMLPILKQLDDLGFQRTAVTVRTEADNPISGDAKVRSAGLAATKRTLDCCQAIGATALVGPYHSALGFFSGKGPTADEWKWGVDSMRQV